MQKHDDQNRLAIAIFIVATTLTVLAMDAEIPSIFMIPVATFVFGLVLSAFFAFLYILAKGYELRYKRKNMNVVDKYNYILYNFAMTAYALVIGLITLSYLHQYLKEASQAGSIWASICIVILYVAVICLMNWRNIKELTTALVLDRKKRHTKQ